MFTVTKHLYFCAAHRLLGYHGDCGNLHGHNYDVLVTIEGRHQLSFRDEDQKPVAFECVGIDPMGFVCDFKKVKRTIGDWITGAFDHALLLNVDDPLCKVVEPMGLKVYFFRGNPTAEVISEVIYRKAEALLFDLPYCIHSMTVYETQDSFATYKESRG